MKRNFFCLIAVLFLALGACSPSKQAVPGASASVVETPLAAPSVVADINFPPGMTHLAYTYQQPDGNRLLLGRGALPQAQPVDILLTDSPLWLISAPLRSGSVWVALLADGQAQAFYVTRQGAVEPMAITPAQLPPGMPPALVVRDGLPQLLVGPDADADASLLSHPLLLTPSGEGQAFIAADGYLVISQAEETTRLPVNALPDARVLQDETGRLLLLAGPTDRYNHGVLGDSFEAESVLLIETRDMLQVVARIAVSPPSVIEGIAPLWADLSGDGQREIIVTVSDAEQGARIVAYDQAGQEIAAGPPIGRGHRWRHQLAVAPFGPNGELELAVVLTPHIGGVVEFYQLTANRLEVVAQVSAYGSHSIGSRNLDSALAGDLDGDGRFELLVPDQARVNLAAIQHQADGAAEVWSVPIGGSLSTNIAAVSFADGSAAVGVGHTGRALRLWLP